jgi:S1-C subfamily serine protease
MRLLVVLLATHFLLNVANVSGAQSTKPIPALIERCKPAVVAVGVYTTSKLPEEAQLPVVGEGKFSTGETVYLYVSGTGFIASSDGYVVTALHVIAKIPEPIPIIMPSGQILSAKVVSTSTEHDFAILKLDLKDAPFLRFGDFSKIAEGDDVLYIGHPFGVPQEISSKGMISWAGKSERGYAFQLNAIVNAGNSGGPLIDTTSERVVGIVSAKYGELSPYLKEIKNGTVVMNINIAGGGFDLQHFVKDVTNMMDLHIQMGIGYAVSSEYAEAEITKARK